VTEHEPISPLRAVVDRDECFGFANCVATLPSVFALDDEGLSHARDVEADPTLLEEAVEGCPRNAISLEWRTGDAAAAATSTDDPAAAQGG
jgi:ferredoxin